MSKLSPLFLALGLALGLFLVGCAGKTTVQKITPLRPCPVERLALAPFLSGQPCEEEDAVACPINAGIFVGQPVRVEALEAMTGQLPMAVESVFSCQLISAKRLAGRLPPAMPRQLGLPVREAIAKAGREVGAQAVLVSTLFRFEERAGSSLAITRAASVSLGLYLIEAETGDVVWQGFFDETQKSLSENLFKIHKFFDRGARWLTAAELGRYGLAELLRRMPVPLD